MSSKHHSCELFLPNNDAGNTPLLPPGALPGLRWAASPSASCLDRAPGHHPFLSFNREREKSAQGKVLYVRLCSQPLQEVLSAVTAIRAEPIPHSGSGQDSVVKA